MIETYSMNKINKYRFKNELIMKYDKYLTTDSRTS